MFGFGNTQTYPGNFAGASNAMVVATDLPLDSILNPQSMMRLTIERVIPSNPAELFIGAEVVAVAFNGNYQNLIYALSSMGKQVIQLNSLNEIGINYRKIVQVRQDCFYVITFQ